MTPLMFLLVLVVVTGIAVGIYFAVKEDDKKSSPSVDANWILVGEKDNSDGNNILYSADGKEWQQSTGESFGGRGFGVAYGTSDGTSPLWVAVGDDGREAPGRGNIMYSADGKEWQETTAGESFAIKGLGVAYGTSNGTSPLWVAVGDDFNGGRGNIMYSADGKEWQETTTGESFAVYGSGVAYGTSDGTSPLWVAVGRDGGEAPRGQGNIMYSANGKEWQESTGMSFANWGNGVAYGTSDGTSPLWVAVGDNNGLGNNILYSANGKEWQESTGLCFTYYGQGVAYGTSDGTSPLWVAVGNADDGINIGGNGSILYSADGKEWQQSTGMSFVSMGTKVAYGASDGVPLWIATGHDFGPDGGFVLYSTDGKEWKRSSRLRFNGRFSGDVAYKSILPNV